MIDITFAPMRTPGAQAERPSHTRQWPAVPRRGDYIELLDTEYDRPAHERLVLVGHVRSVTWSDLGITVIVG